MRKTLSILLMMLLLLSAAPVIAQEYRPPHGNPGPASDKIIFRKIDQDLAPSLVEKGEIDLYLFNLKVSIASEYLRSEKVRIYEAPSTSISIIMNPAPAPEGELNPFSLKKVRQAVQYLIDREFIVNEIYKGFAVPMYAHISPLEYDYLVVSEVVAELGYTYDPDYAAELIREAMEEAGAELVDGRWTYNGKPVEVKFLIRVEDERREVGDLLAKELEDMGFTVRRIYMEFGPAIATVYGTDPAQFEWHLYTEGWGKTSIERYDYATLNQMCAPWLGNMPGWLEVGFWQYRNKVLDELGQRLFRGEYRDLEERNRLYKEATRLCMEESIRAWVATVKNALPATPELRGVSLDAASGLRSIWTLRSAYLPGGEIRVGHLWVRPYAGSAWNPVAGFTDVYSVDIWRLLHDPPVWRHPFTGIPQPFRADYEVETAGPEGSIEVPPDAFIWDAEEGGWRMVGEGVEARSKVVFDYGRYLGSRWHHGAEITWADILYQVYQTFDIVYNPEKSKIEVALSATRKPILETFKGFRFVDENTLEVYVDYWHFDENYIAEYAEPWGALMPWEILYAMDKLVFEERKAAYSDTAAARLQVDWLNLIESNQARRLVRILRQLMESGEYPAEVFNAPGVSDEMIGDPLERYGKAVEWFQRYGHLVVSNGPYILSRMGSVAEQYAELTAFRDPSYPFKPEDFYVGEPPGIEVTAPMVAEARVGEELSMEVEVQGPGETRLKVMLINPLEEPEKRVAYQDYVQVMDGVARVSIPGDVISRLGEGVYKLHLIAFSDQVSLVSQQVLELEVLEKAPETATTVAETTPATQTPTMVETVEEAEAPAPINLLVILIPILLVIAAIIALLIRRRRR